MLLQSASGLRDSDAVGLSDPYAVIRLGPASSAWADKTNTPFGERRSTVEANTLDPAWQCAFSLGSPPSDGGWAASGWELHVRVYDHDYASFDDALGEVRIALPTLLSHPDTLRDYTLSQQGSIRLMAGDRVATALEEAAQAEVEHASGLSQILTAAGRLGQYMESAFATYNATMLSFLFAIKTCFRLVAGVDGQPPAMVDGLTAWLDRRTEGSGRWAGPLEPATSTTYTSHAEVSARLAALGQRLGRSDGDGEVARGNWLGFQRLNSRCWPEVPWRGIGLGAPQEAHAWIRPIIYSLCGAQGEWSSAKVDEAAAAFFALPGGAARTEFRAVRDLKLWVCQVLHEVLDPHALFRTPCPTSPHTPHHTPLTTRPSPHTAQILHEVLFGEPISEARAIELVALQWTWMKCMAAPDGALDVPGLRQMLGLDAFLPAKVTLTPTPTLTATRIPTRNPSPIPCSPPRPSCSRSSSRSCAAACPPRRSAPTPTSPRSPRASSTRSCSPAASRSPRSSPTRSRCPTRRRAQPVHTVACTRPAHGLHTACTRPAHGLHTACTRPAHGLHTACTQPAHGLHTACTRPAHGLHTACTRPVGGGRLHTRCTRAAWAVHGRCMGAAWAVHGRCTRAAWALHGRCMGAAWAVHGRCMGGAWALHGRCMGAAWALHTRCMGAAWALHGRCMGAAWALHGRCMGAAWALHGRCMGAAWAVHGRCERQVGGRRPPLRGRGSLVASC